MYVLIVALLAFVLVAPAHAQVHIDIGIHLPAPPRLVVVPEVRAVQYVPAAPANFFFYNGQYWVFVNGGWHVSAGYNGPWAAVAPQFVPRPVLLVPVHYYRVPPGHWKQWNKRHPPRWDNEWGREWAAKREWKERKQVRQDERDRGRGHGAAKRDRKEREDEREGERDRGRGHGRDR